jgi:hypothetical protein
MRRALLFLAALAVPLSAQQPNRELAALQEAIGAVGKQEPFDYARYQALADSARRRVAAMIERDALRTAADFLAASSLAADPTGWYENRRVEHELALAALVLGHPDAPRRVKQSWDALNWSIGRGQRFGSFARDGVPDNMDPVPAPAVVRRVLDSLPAARAAVAGRADHAELQRLRDLDQMIRQPPIDAAKQRRMREEDPPRRARVLALIEQRAPATGRDFHNAALVLQHGGRPDDYRLAHELSLAAIALGDTSATWLVSRTYDRWLLSLGHRQRFATQYGGARGDLRPIDTTATNDRMRTLLGSRPLAESMRPPRS